MSPVITETVSGERIVTGGPASDKQAQLLLAIAGLLTLSYLLNTTTVFDNNRLPRHFAALVAQRGYLESIVTLTIGLDLPTEYYTYALSRLLQFGIWVVAGNESWPYSALIALTHAGTAHLLLLIVRVRGFDESTALAIPLGG